VAQVTPTQRLNEIAGRVKNEVMDYGDVQDFTWLLEEVRRRGEAIKEMQDVLRVNLNELQFCHEFEEPFLHGIEHNSFVDSCPLCKIQKYHQNVFSYSLERNEDNE
jgi:hypothetical protein